MPVAKFERDILGVTLQDGPINLLHLDLNLTAAKTDSTTLKAKISSKIIPLATPSVFEHLFNQLCAGYSKEPHTDLDHICQTYKDANGNTIFCSVFYYYPQMCPALSLTKKCFLSV